MGRARPVQQPARRDAHLLAADRLGWWASHLLDTRRDRPVRHDARVAQRRRRSSRSSSKFPPITGSVTWNAWSITAVASVVLVAIGLVWAGYVAATRETPETTIANPVSPEEVMGRNVSFTIPADPRLLILGDSYTLGTAANPPTEGYAYTVARDLGWPSEIDGVGGTGFTWGGGNEGADGNDYVSRIQRRAAAGSFSPNVLLLQGGQNDYRAEPDVLYAKVRETIDAARQAWPDVQVIVMGPSQPMPGGALLGRVSSPIGQAAIADKAQFISPLQENWFTDENSRQYYGDANGSHLNNDGHLYMASKIMDRLRDLGVPVT